MACRTRGRGRTAPASAVTRFALTATRRSQLLVDPQSRDLSITRDGTRIVYKGGIPRRSHATVRLSPRPARTRTADPTGLPKGPFISPDGQWVGYFEPGSGRARRSRRSHSPADRRSSSPGSMAPAAAQHGLTIGRSSPRRARRRPACFVVTIGRRPACPDPPESRARRGRSRCGRRRSPAGDKCLFTITALTGGLDAAQVGRARPGVWRVAASAAAAPAKAQYVSSGHLVYVAGGALWADRVRSGACSDTSVALASSCHRSSHCRPAPPSSTSRMTARWYIS